MSNYLSIKILNAMKRLEREHPDIFSIETPTTIETEKAFNEAWAGWFKDPKVTTEYVRTKFKVWTDSLIEANRQTELFAPLS